MIALILKEFLMNNPLDWQERLIINVRKNLYSIMALVFFVFAVMGIIEYREVVQKNKNEQLSSMLINWKELTDAGKFNEAAELGQKMNAQFPGELISNLVQSALAKRYIVEGKIDKAADIYNQLVKNCQGSICDLYRLRLGLIYLNKEEPNNCIATLNTIKSPIYSTTQLLYLGDAYKQLGDNTQSYQLWEKAYKKIKKNTFNEVDKGLQEQLVFRLQTNR